MEIKPLYPQISIITGQVIYTYPMDEILASLEEHMVGVFGEAEVELAVAVSEAGDVVITAYRTVNNLPPE